MTAASVAGAAKPLDVLRRVAVVAGSEGRVAPARLDADALHALRGAPSARIALPLPEGGVATLELERFEVLTPDALVTATGEAGPAVLRPDVALFRGRVAGEPGSWAVLGCGPRSVTGIVERGGSRYALSPVRGAGLDLHEVVAAPDLPPRGAGFQCDVVEPEGGSAAPRPSRTRRLVPEATTPRLVCRLAIDADYEFAANKFGGDTAAASQYLLTVLGVVSSIYERDLGVTLSVPYLNLWITASDPYSATTTNGTLSEFRNWWNANRGGVSRDLAHLVSGRGLGGGIAYLRVLCQESSGYAASALDAAYLYPNASATWDSYVIAHELGHNFGSPHTQSCFWQQNGYAPSGALLDSCYAAEGQCYAGPAGTLPSAGKGTIMSYCHTVAGVANGIWLDFHPACATETRGHAEDCLGTTALQPASGLAVTAGNWTSQLAWAASPSPGIVRYDVYRSAFSDDPAPALVGSTTGLAYTDPNRLGTYWYKVRAATSGAPAPFSAQARVSVCPPANAAGWPAGSQTRGPVLADLNGDGVLDAALANNNLSGTVSVLRGQGAGGAGNGAFAAPVAYACNTKPVAIAAADLDDDGILDLVVANDALVGTISRLRGRGAGGAGDGTFDPPVRDTTGSRPAALAIADFDEDGVLDVATANFGGNSVSVLRGVGTNGVGTGTFAPRADYPVALGPVAIAAADFDEDGILDLAVVCKSSGAVSVLRGLGAAGVGDGHFVPAGSYAVGSAAVAIAAGDFDADGITDLAVARQVAAGQAVVLRGQGGGGVGNGAFGSGGSFACGPSPYALLAADLDGNGVTDLVASNSGTTLASVALGQGDGTFQAPQFFAGTAEAAGVATGDFDADGTIDLALATSGATGLTTLPGSCPATGVASLDVTAPDGGEEWPVRSERVVSWAKGLAVAAVHLELTRDGGARWERIASDLSGTAFTWTVTPPATSGATARLRLVDASDPSRRATSALPFTIGAPTVAVAGNAPARLGLAVVPAGGPDLAFAVTLPDAAPARLDVLDVAGRRVASHAVGGLGAGTHMVRVPGASLASGIYLVRLARAGERLTRKAVVTR